MAMARRRRIPKSTETAVLTSSLRRCCICVALSSDHEIKQGQIAHLDRNPNNNSEDNLAFLCMPHHDRLDSRTSQSKNFTANEVKRYRNELYSRNAMRQRIIKTKRRLPRNAQRVLLVDDQLGDLLWLLDFLESNGFSIDVANSEKAAKQLLDAASNGERAYALAIFDIMIAPEDIMELIDLSKDYFERSKDGGLRLCRYARQELRLSEEGFPIVCVSARNDESLVRALADLNIPLFSRTPGRSSESLQCFLENFILAKKKEVPLAGQTAELKAQADG